MFRGTGRTFLCSSSDQEPVRKRRFVERRTCFQQEPRKWGTPRGRSSPDAPPRPAPSPDSRRNQTASLGLPRDSGAVLTRPCSLRDGGSVPGMSCPRAPRADATARRRAWEAAAEDFSSLAEAGDEGAGPRPGTRLLVKKKKEKRSWKWQAALSHLKFDNTPVTSLF